MPEVSITGADPEEAIRFFGAKLPRESWDWRDMWQQEHARQFTVAKSAGRDVLTDIYSAVQDAIQNGTTFDDFRDRLEPVLAAKGWWGKAPDIDPLTGQPVTVQLGSVRRLQTIFDVNLRMAYAAGSWERIMRTARDRPYLMYTAVHDDRTRPQHRAWDGTTLPVGDAWWDTHYPPNGWNCRCTVITLDPQQYASMSARGDITTGPPPVELDPWTNKRTGQTIMVPDGVDPGFGYNVGKAYLRDLTPPPLPGAPGATPAALDLYPKAGRPPLPQPRPATAALMPQDLPDADYIAAFKDEISKLTGRSVGDGAVVQDKLGLPIPVTDRFFVRDDGTMKLYIDPSRKPFVRMLAQTLLEPDEIWLSFESVKGGYRLVRRYLGRWQLGKQNGIVVVEESKDGWRGVSAFSNDSESYPDNAVRIGYLAYRRPGGTGDANDVQE